MNSPGGGGAEVLGLAGAGVGYAVGGKWGATAGLIVGQLVGTYLFPPHYPKPEITDSITGAQTGQIPYVFGTTTVTGNCIWNGGTTVKSETSSGKGGRKSTTGYKYYKSGAWGICTGKADLGRMWRDANLYYPLGSGNIEFYRGTDSQAVDPTMDASLDNATPMHGLVYQVSDGEYIGKSQQDYSRTYEVHRYPFNTAAGDYNRILTTYNDSTTVGGIVLKDSYGKIIVVHRTYIKVYNRDLTLDKTITIEDDWAIPDTTRYFDADLVESGGHQYLYIIYSKATSHYLCMIKCDISHKTMPTTKQTNGNYWELVASSTNTGAFTFNNDYFFVAYSVGATNYCKKYAFGSPGTALATYTLSHASIAGTPVRDISANADYLFALNDDNVVCMDFTTTYVDHEGCGFTDGRLAVLKGGNDVFAHSTYSVVEEANVIDWFTYTEAGVLTEQQVIDMTDYWTDGVPPWSDDELLYQSISSAPDGTLMIGGQDSAGAEFGLMHILMDANPSQVIYDLLVEENQVSTDDINLTSLTSLSEYCVTNALGISGSVISSESIDAVLQNIMFHIHGNAYIDNSGLIAFKVYQSTDSSVATITTADIQVIACKEDDSTEGGDFSQIQETVKDRALRANRILVSYSDRLARYGIGKFDDDNFLAQVEDERVNPKEIQYQYFSNKWAAGKMGRRIKWIEYYDRYIYELPLIPKYLYLSVGDVITVTVASQDLASDKMRVISINEPPMDAEYTGLIVTCRAEFDFLNNFEIVDPEANLSEDLTVKPPSDVVPFVFEIPPLWNDGQPALCFSAYRETSDTVGCAVFVSEDNTSFVALPEELTDFAIVGDIAEAFASDSNRLVVNYDNYLDALTTFTRSEQRSNLSFALLGELQADDLELSELEFISYRELETDGDNKALRNCARGLYYTLEASHDTDGVILLVGRHRFVKYDFNDSKIGKTIYVKFVPFNSAGDALDFDEVVSYEYTIAGNTIKATHTSGLELRVSDEGIGSLEVIDTNDTIIQWKRTNRVGGEVRFTAQEWTAGNFTAGDADAYDLLVYNSGGTLVATHADITPTWDATDEVYHYTYTEAMNTTDFGGLTKDFYLGIRPKNGYGVGYVEWVRKKHVVINT